MGQIFGVGAPSKKRPSGTIYVNKQNGIRYIQTLYPNGNVWEIIDSSENNSTAQSETPITLPPTVISAVTIFNTSQIYNFSEISQMGTGFFINPQFTISDSSGPSGLINIISVYSTFSGNSFTNTSMALRTLDYFGVSNGDIANTTTPFEPFVEWLKPNQTVCFPGTSSLILVPLTIMGDDPVPDSGSGESLLTIYLRYTKI